MALKFARLCKRSSKSHAAKCQPLLLHLSLHPLLHLPPLLLQTRPRQTRPRLKRSLQWPKSRANLLSKTLNLLSLILLPQPKHPHLRLPPKLHHVLWWRYVAMTVQVKSAPRWPLLGAAVMASPVVVSLATALAVTKVLVLAATAMVLRHAAHVWAMQHSVRSVLRWSLRKTLYVAWPRKRMVKC
jgi:hypothetical protein